MQPRARFNDDARGFHAGAVPGHARQVPALRPAAVAIHDDRDMPRQPLRVEAFQQASLFAAGRFKQFGWLHSFIPMSREASPTKNKMRESSAGSFTTQS
jgi:hypothetical protein